MTHKPEERRRRPRISTMILCELDFGEPVPTLARVRDLSECGSKVATPLLLVPGSRLRLRLPGTDNWILARVAWCKPGIAGLAFAQAVDLPGVSGAQAWRAGDESIPARRRSA